MSTRPALSAAGIAAPVLAVAAVLGVAAATATARSGRVRLAAANLRRSSAPSAWAYDAVLAPLLGGLYARIADDAAAALATAGTATVLDVGGGPGHVAVLIARRRPDATIVGADIDPAMVARASARAQREGFGDRVRFEVADVAGLPLEAESVDLVVSSFSLHHWPDPAAALCEIHRVLRPGGRAILYDLPRAWVRLETGAADPVQLAAASPFGGSTLRRLRWPWNVPSCVRLELVRPASGDDAVRAADGARA
jgi:ubiquinone/menaquinone biosynthesis C-methylase UbiE